MKMTIVNNDDRAGAFRPSDLQESSIPCLSIPFGNLKMQEDAFDWLEEKAKG
jgi:hypothetical protein